MSQPIITGVPTFRGPQVQPESDNLGGGAVAGWGWQPSSWDVDSEWVGGIPSVQPAHYYDQWAARPPFHIGEVAWGIRPQALALSQGGLNDITLGNPRFAPPIPRGIPGQWQRTGQIGFGNTSAENIGLRAPKVDEGAGCDSVTGSLAANGFGS
jgi:hypothetical protein